MLCVFAAFVCVALTVDALEGLTVDGIDPGVVNATTNQEGESVVRDDAYYRILASGNGRGTSSRRRYVSCARLFVLVVDGCITLS